MTVLLPAWLQTGEYDAEEDRAVITSFLSGGSGALSARAGIRRVTGTEFQVTQTASPSMSVNVAAGMAWVVGTFSSNQGAYVVINDATVNVSISASNGSNPRIDLVILEVLDEFYSGAVSAGQIRVVTGTPSVSPAVPATPASSIVLARVRVNAGVTSVATSNITDTRPSTSAFGGIPVVGATDDNPGLHVGIHRYHPTHRLQSWNGSIWEPANAGNPKAVVLGSGTQSISNNVRSVVTLAGSTHVAGGMSYSTATSRLTVTIPGYYFISGGVTYEGSTDLDGVRAASFLKNGTHLNHSQNTVWPQSNNTVSVTSRPILVSMTTSDYLQLATIQTSGSTKTIERAESSISAIYAGALS